MITAVVFDVDGTLQDWEASISHGLRRTLADVPPGYREGIQERLGRAVAEYTYVVRDGRVVDRRHWMLLVDPAPPWQAVLAGAAPETALPLAQRFRERLDMIPFDDARPALEALHGRYALGVLSNSPRAEAMLEHLGLRPYFAAVVVATHPRAKPHAHGFVQACQALGAAPAETAYVGDSLANDVEGALAAGLVPVWVDRYDDGYAVPGCHRIATLTELPALLAGLGGREAAAPGERF
jgi:HAD superfamily hydrolase (TIGR01509 family)